MTNDIELRWEQEIIEAGIKAYRASLVETQEHKDGTTTRESKRLGDTKPGHMITRDVVESILGPIAALRDDVIQQLADGTVRGQWSLPVVALQPDVLTTVVARCIFTTIAGPTKGTADQRGVSTTRMAIRIADVLLDQLSFETWKRKSAEDAKESEEPDWAKIILSKYKGTPNRMFVYRMRQRFKGLEKLDLSSEDKLKLGIVLLRVTIAHGGGWVHEVRTYKRGKPQNRVDLTDEAKSWIVDQHAQCELWSPPLWPMLIPPNPV